MSIVQRYLNRGWRIIGNRHKASEGRSKVLCPHEGCGLTLEITNRVKSPHQAVSVENLPDLTLAIANRRHDLGLSSDDIDYCAGLAQRHVQKVEDAGRNVGEGRRTSEDIMLALLQRVADEGMTPETRRAVDAMITTKLALIENGAQRPRVPKLDTVLLIVQAMGGRILIDWSNPPKITQRLIDTSGQRQKTKATA